MAPGSQERRKGNGIQATHGADFMTPPDMSKANLDRGFTDAQLEQLKKDMAMPEKTMFLDEHEINAILNRLDAAEDVIRNLQMSNGSIEFFLANANSVQAWLRSKGLPPSGDGEKGDR